MAASKDPSRYPIWIMQIWEGVKSGKIEKLDFNSRQEAISTRHKLYSFRTAMDESPNFYHRIEATRMLGFEIRLAESTLIFAQRDYAPPELQAALAAIEVPIQIEGRAKEFAPKTSVLPETYGDEIVRNLDDSDIPKKGNLF